MHDIRGTLILADQVYRSVEGKWIIAGTYSSWRTAQDVLTLTALNFYIRLQVERPGNYPCRLFAIDRSGAPNLPLLWESVFDIKITESGIPVFETAIKLSDTAVRSPVPFAQRPVGKWLMLRTLVWLQVGDSDVASCPLDFVFVGPKAETDQDPDQKIHE